MNFKKMSFFVIILGLVVLAYGIIEYQNNQPVSFNTANSRQSVFGGRDDLGNYVQTRMGNLSREARQKEMIKYIASGAGMIFLGLGILLSSKKKK